MDIPEKNNIHQSSENFQLYSRTNIFQLYLKYAMLFYIYAYKLFLSLYFRW